MNSSTANPRARPLVALLALFAVLASIGLVAGQDDPPAVVGEVGEGEEIFFETVDVNVVNVDVYVRDKKGNPIGGLTRDDFEILEDGRSVEISNFYVVEGGERVQDAVVVELDEPAEPEVAPAVVTRAAAPPERPSSSRSTSTTSTSGRSTAIGCSATCAPSSSTRWRRGRRSCW